MLKSVLSSTAIQDQHYLIGSLWLQFAHHVFYLLQFIHQVHLVVQSSCRIYQHYISAIGLGTLQSIIGHRGGVSAHLLLDNTHAYPLSPNGNLLNSGSAESISGSQIDFLASLLELISQFAYGCGFTYTIDPNHQYHVWRVIRRQIPVF